MARGPRFPDGYATDEEKVEIRDIFDEILTRLEADRFVILSDTGERIKFDALDALWFGRGVVRRHYPTRALLSLQFTDGRS